jgi:5'-nucleotidase/UDP-sugar diphosphatase
MGVGDMGRIILAALITLAVAGTLPAAGAEEPVRIVIMHTNDIHGGIDRRGATFMDEEFPPALGGGASLVTLVKQVRADAEAEGKGFLLFDTGDYWQGTPVGNYRQGQIVAEFLNRAGYDARVPGNHEFDAGWEEAFEQMKSAEMPVLAANLVERDTGEIPFFLKPYIIKEVHGIKIGIIGLITEETDFYSKPEHVSNVEFLPVKEVTQTYIAEIEDEVDLIFVLGHLGIPYDVATAYQEMVETGTEMKIRYGMNAMELVHSVKGIDVFVGGHIHVGYEGGWEDPVTHTICLQTYGRGSGIGIYEILVDPETRTVVGYDLPEGSGQSITTLFEDEYWPDPETAEFLGEWIDSAEVGMDEPIGRALHDISRVGVGESPLGNMVTDAMREAVDADVAFTNLGGIRSNIAMGSITPRDVFYAVPFENHIVYYEMSGSFLKHVLEWRVKGMRQGAYISGTEIVYSRERPDFDRITYLTVGGEPWDPDRVYRVATTDFIAAGNVGLQILTDIDPQYISHSDIAIKDAIIEYIKKHSPVDPKVEGRFRRDDSAEMSPDLAAALPRWKPLDELDH